MELYDNDFLEELLSLRRESCTWDTNNNNPCSEVEENHHNFFSNNGYSNSFDSSFDQNSPYSSSLVQNSYITCQELPHQSNYNNYNNNNDHNHNHNHNHHYTFNEIYCSLLEEFSAPQIIDHSPSSYNNNTPPSFLPHQDDCYYDLFSMNMEEEDNNNNNNPLGLVGEEEIQTVCKVEQSQSLEEEVPVFNSNTGGTISMDGKNRAKKMQGQPSKNLMAERRRRKRLNDRLSMLRSIVPKISKMDRTSILGDTIDYMKELLNKINSLKQEIEVDSNGIFNEIKPNEMLVRNSPKFDVERRNVNTRVEICCAGKPGLLLSTVNTLEALGLEIQHCVISCFNDFTMQASCSEELEHKEILSPEDIKQALFRSAGYGGRCLY